MLYVDWVDGIGIGWSSKVISLLRTPSVLIQYMEIPDQRFQHFYPTQAHTLTNLFSKPDPNPPDIEKPYPLGPAILPDDL